MGLSVILDAESSEHLPAPRENSGFKILIHPKDEVPNLQDFGIELDVGKLTAIRVETREVTNHTYFW